MSDTHKFQPGDKARVVQKTGVNGVRYYHPIGAEVEIVREDGPAAFVTRGPWTKDGSSPQDNVLQYGVPAEDLAPLLPTFEIGDRVIVAEGATCCAGFDDPSYGPDVPADFIGVPMTVRRGKPDGDGDLWLRHDDGRVTWAHASFVSPAPEEPEPEPSVAEQVAEMRSSADDAARRGQALLDLARGLQNTARAMETLDRLADAA